MAIEVGTNFQIKTNLPIDSRSVKNTVAERNAIPASERYEGLRVLVTEENSEYELRGGIGDGNWVNITHRGINDIDGLSDALENSAKALDIVRRSAAMNITFLDTNNFDVTFDGPTKTVTIEKKSTAKDDNLVYALTEANDEIFLNDLNLATVARAFDNFKEFFTYTGDGESRPLVITAVKPFAFGFTVANTEQYHGKMITPAVGAVDEASGYLEGVGAVQTVFFCGPKENDAFVWAGPWVEQAKVAANKAKLDGMDAALAGKQAINNAYNQLTIDWHFKDWQFDGEKYIFSPTTDQTFTGKDSIVARIYFKDADERIAQIYDASIQNIFGDTSATSFSVEGGALIVSKYINKGSESRYFDYKTRKITSKAGPTTSPQIYNVSALAVDRPELSFFFWGFTNTDTSGIETQLNSLAQTVQTVMTNSHTHSNKTVLDGITINQITNWNGAYDHSQKTDNPHKVSKAQVGLGNADNTADKDKPVSAPQQSAIEFSQTAALEALRLAGLTERSVRNNCINWTMPEGSGTVTADLTGSAFTGGKNFVWMSLGMASEINLTIKLPQSAMECNGLYIRIPGIGSAAGASSVTYSIAVDGKTVFGGNVQWNHTTDAVICDHELKINASGKAVW